MLFEIGLGLGLGYFENALAMLRLRLCYFKKAQAQAQAHVISRILGLGYFKEMLKISKSFNSRWKANQMTGTMRSEFHLPFALPHISFSCLTFLPDYGIFGSYNLYWNDWGCESLGRYICMKGL